MALKDGLILFLKKGMLWPLKSCSALPNSKKGFFFGVGENRENKQL